MPLCLYREGTQSTESTWLNNAVGCTLRDYTALRESSFTRQEGFHVLACIDATKPGSAFSSREGGSACGEADGCGWMWLWQVTDFDEQRYSECARFILDQAGLR